MSCQPQRLLKPFTPRQDQQLTACPPFKYSGAECSSLSGGGGGAVTQSGGGQEGGIQGGIVGQTRFPLDEFGAEKASLLGKWLRGWDGVGGGGAALLFCTSKVSKGQCVAPPQKYFKYFSRCRRSELHSAPEFWTFPFGNNGDVRSAREGKLCWSWKQNWLFFPVCEG